MEEIFHAVGRSSLARVSRCPGARERLTADDKCAQRGAFLSPSPPACPSSPLPVLSLSVGTASCQPALETHSPGRLQMPAPQCRAWGPRPGLVTHLGQKPVGRGVRALPTKPLQPHAEVSPLGNRADQRWTGLRQMGVFSSQAWDRQSPSLCPRPCCGPAISVPQPQTRNWALVQLGC